LTFAVAEEDFCMWIDWLLQRHRRNNARSSVGAIAGAPVEAVHDEAPRAVMAYLLNTPGCFGTTLISSDVEVDKIENFRGFEQLVIAEGWSGLEPWGVWTEGKRAVLYVRSPFTGLEPTPGTEILGDMVMDARASISEAHPNITV
jgi:hypothetical protein